jgi:hypothetical protein
VRSPGRRRERRREARAPRERLAPRWRCAAWGTTVLLGRVGQEVPGDSLRRAWRCADARCRRPRSGGATETRAPRRAHASWLGRPDRRPCDAGSVAASESIGFTSTKLRMPQTRVITCADEQAHPPGTRIGSEFVRGSGVHRCHRVRDAMSFTTCSASLPTPGRNPDDIA